MIFNLLILGALSAALIPVFSSILFKDEKRAWQVLNNFLNIVLVFLIGTLFIIFVGAPLFVKIITPGFSGEQLTNTILLTRIMLLSPLLFAFSSVIGGVLNSFGRFFVYSLAPILYNLGIICGALYLVPIWGLSGLAWGVVFGAMAHLLVQLPTFIRVGFRPMKIFNLKDPDFRRMIYLMLPVTLGLAATQINFLIDNIIGSTLQEGSIAVFNLANNIAGFPVGLVGISFAVSCFPLLSYAYNHQKHKVFSDSFTKTFNLIVYLMVPAMVFALILRAQIVRILLGAGLFSVTNTIWTSRTLGYFAMGLIAQGLIPFLVRSFYATSNTRTPVKIAFLAVAANIIFSILFTKVFDFKVAGLAISSTIAAFVNLFFLLVCLKERFTFINFNTILLATAKYFVFSIIAGLMIYKGLYWMEPYVDTLTTIGLAIQTGIAALVGVFSYLLLSALFKSSEAERLLNVFNVVFRGGKK
ncbi:TPA: murein biosynthesis integral membrane protein MurJ [Candidatus Woesearchaeota archaeon]|nr:murein biosynthesis integral membrane protein MurJ [Candidatus Woesearchaeota archaeon]